MSAVSNQPELRALFARAVQLNPGAWAVDRETPMATLLGSCVAVCFYCKRTGLAGMNHFLIPSRATPDEKSEDIVLAGDASMEVLLNGMLTRGARKRDITAKVFGGGTIVSSIKMAIGERNARFALEWLAREGIPVAASDVLGNYSRKVLMDPATGDVWCRRAAIDANRAKALVCEEDAYEKRMRQSAKAPQVELF